MRSYSQKRKQKGHAKRKNFLRKNKRIKKLVETKEFSLLVFFGFLFFIIIGKLLFIQVINANYYENQISQLHYKEALLKAERGHIYTLDKNNNPLQLTENITVYDLYVEPQHLKNDDNKEKFINIISPYVYEHLCIRNGIESVTKEQCLKNLESFTNKTLLPEKPEFFYLGSGLVSTGYYSYDRSGFNAQYSGTINGMTEQAAQRLITEKLNERIYIGIRNANYLGFFDDTNLLEELTALDFTEVYNNYVYIIPTKIGRQSTAGNQLERILSKYKQENLIDFAKEQLNPKENTYVKIIRQIHPSIANAIKDLKKEYKNNYQSCKYEEDKEGCEKYIGKNIDFSLLHGLGLEEYTIRHYPYNDFMAHTLGYVSREGNPTYGVEEFMNAELKGKDGKIIGRASSFIGDIGANEFEIEEVQNGNDVYLTIDPTLQKEVENITSYYKDFFEADSVSVLVMDPYNGKLKANVTSPGFNPNNFNSAFTYEPLSIEDAEIIDDLSFTDIHLFVKDENGDMRKATTEERQDPNIAKYKTQNTYSSEIFVDKNIKYPYEPGSIFKPITVAIGLDSDELELFDFYEDKGRVQVGPYIIENISEHCLGENNFLNALIYSCNVGMVRIVQRVGREIFFNYLKKLGLGKKTGIELAGEEEGFIEPVATVSLARFLNNSFGLGMRATPIQIATSYASIINGGYLIKPTIIEKIYDTKAQEMVNNQTKIVRKVFKNTTAEKIKTALFDVIHTNEFNNETIAVEGYSLGGKSGTSEITYKGKYQTQGRGRTNASFIGIVTKENLKYLVTIQVRRPRTEKRGASTAGIIFKDIATFLINYDLISQ